MGKDTSPDVEEKKGSKWIGRGENKGAEGVENLDMTLEGVTAKGMSCFSKTKEPGRKKKRKKRERKSQK